MPSIHIQTKNCEVDAALQSHIDEKLVHIEKMWPKSETALLRLATERGRTVAEMTLHWGGLVLRGEERAANVRAAIDGAIEKLESQLRRYKTKLMTRERRHDNRDDVSGEVLKASLGASGLASDGVSPSAAVDLSAHEEDASLDVVRVKRFALKPMAAEEAALQMGLLGHNFFVFRDAETDQTSVVYRRSNGGYGLIEPVAD